MNVNVISSTENKLLDRKEIEAEVSFDGATPKRDELKAAVCQKIAVNPDVTVLRKVESSFGTKSVRVTAYSYLTKEALVATEADYIQNREGMKEKPAPKEGEAPEAPPAKEKAKEKAPEKKEEKKEEPKKEEKKEEPKKEEKPPEKKEEKKEEPKKE